MIKSGSRLNLKELYQTLFENSNEILLIMEQKTGDIVHANQAACTFYGYQYSELITMNINELIQNDYEKEKQFTLNTTKRSYFVHKLKSGKLNRVEIKDKTIELNGKTYLYAIITDIEKVFDQQLVLNELFNESPDPSLIIDEHGFVIAINKNYTKLFGYTPEELINQSILTFIERDFKREVVTNLERVMLGETVNIKTIRKSKDEKKFHVNIIATPYILNSKMLGALLIYKDITKQVELQKEIAEFMEMKNQEIKDSKEQLQLILDSTAEGIFGMDLEGICTFCNRSGFKLLGYKHQDEVLGKRINELIHHTSNSGKPIFIDKCRITQSLKDRKGVHSENDIFYRKDGTHFHVEYNSYPQFKNGELFGAVVTFTDNTERKKYEEEIRFLSSYDSLTKLYNRKYFEDQLNIIDKDETNLPISIIFGDLNGLKLTNDVFGHIEGDKLLIKAAEILKSVCGNHVIARIGGDEFAIIMSNTNEEEVSKAVKEIEKKLENEDSLIIKASISLGYETKNKSDEDIQQIIKDAEGYMYKHKLISRDQTNVKTVDTIVKLLHQKSEFEKQHAINVSELCFQMGKVMKKNDNELRKLKNAGYLHDIGKIALSDNLLTKKQLNDEDIKLIREHPVTGYRILNIFDHTVDLADGVLNHHEYWNGTGYPKGIREKEIPELARIIAIAEAYDTATNPLGKYKKSKTDAINELKQQSGIKYDPELVEIFVKMIS